MRTTEIKTFQIDGQWMKMSKMKSTNDRREKEDLLWLNQTEHLCRNLVMLKKKYSPFYFFLLHGIDSHL